MDGLIIWKTILIFLFLFFFLWIIFYTFQPDFFGEDDKAKNGTRGTCTGDDCYLSARGRTKLFLATIIPAAIVSLIYFVSSYKFSKTVTVKCDKNAKKIGQCKIQR